MPRFPVSASHAALVQGWPIKVVAKYVFADTIGHILDVVVAHDTIHVTATPPFVEIQPDTACLMGDVRNRLMSFVSDEWQLDYVLDHLTCTRQDTGVQVASIVVALRRTRPLFDEA